MLYRPSSACLCWAGSALVLCSWTAPAQTISQEPDFPLATPVAAVEGVPDPLTFAGKTDYFLKAAFSPQSLARIAFTTGFGQIDGASREWGTGSEAFGRRMHARYAGHVAARTIQFSIGAIRGEDPRFYRSGKEGFWARTGFVLSRTVLVQMDGGGTSVAAGRLAGFFTSQSVQAHLRPYEPNPWQRSVTNAGISLGSDVGIRMFREFWPDIKKVFRRP